MGVSAINHNDDSRTTVLDWALRLPAWCDSRG
jgi:hypothetical protein